LELFSIPGKLTVSWQDEVRAVVDTWINYMVTVEEFRNAVLVKGLSHARANGGQAWIVDSSRAKGVFSQEIQAFIDTDIFPALAGAGIRYFITITSDSVLTRMTVSNYSSKAGPHGLTLVNLGSVEEAVSWLKRNAVAGCV
jgi:hypothetical protein